MDKDRIEGAQRPLPVKVADRVEGNIAGGRGTQASGRQKRPGAHDCRISTARPRTRARRQEKRRRQHYAKSYDNSGDTLRDGSKAMAQDSTDHPLGALLVEGGIGFAWRVDDARRAVRRRAGGYYG